MKKSSLLQITSVATRQRLVQNLPTTAGGGTKICAGIEKGLEIITNAIGTTYGSEIVLLTDGEDSTMSLCREK